MNLSLLVSMKSCRTPLRLLMLHVLVYAHFVYSKRHFVSSRTGVAHGTWKTDVSSLVAVDTSSVDLCIFFPHHWDLDMVCYYNINFKWCIFALKVKPINERLREIKGAKMIVDVVQTPFAPLKRVIQFVSGNGLVCDTVKEARQIAFEGPVRLKVRRWM